MGLDLGLHRALDKLSGGAVVLGYEKGKVRREEDERDLVVSARIFLSLYLMDFLLSTGSGRPHMCDEDLVSSEKLTAMLRRVFLWRQCIHELTKPCVDILSRPTATGGPKFFS